MLVSFFLRFRYYPVKLVLAIRNKMENILLNSRNCATDWCVLVFFSRTFVFFLSVDFFCSEED
jgi:hypothetical protein